MRRTRQRMTARCGLDIHDLDGVLITHEHTDHVRAVGQILKRSSLPLYMTEPTMQSMDCFSDTEYPKRVIDVEPLRPLRIGALNILPVPTLHDAARPVGYVLSSGYESIAFLTDTGTVLPETANLLRGLNAIVLEFNHDPDMLWTGSYPRHIKARISGNAGHLSNGQAARLLQEIRTPDLSLVVAAHISQNNNSPDLVRQALFIHADSRIRTFMATPDGMDSPIVLHDRRKHPMPV